jgi:hypothetical protein
MMICKRCKGRFDPKVNEQCPHCGEQSVALASGVIKSSTIVVATAGRLSVFRSLKEVPDPLRRKLTEATTGPFSGTILIADKRGREEITRMVRRLPSLIQARFWSSLVQRGSAAGGRWHPAVRAATAVFLILFAAILIWLLIGQHP